MRPMRFILLAAFISVGLTSPLTAGWNEFMHAFHQDYMRMRCWPKPFILDDRVAARAPFAIMESKGWSRQNTLGHEQFDADTHELTQAGVLKLRWILTHSPPSRRSVFVYGAEQSEITSIRVDSVQQHVVRLAPQGQLPSVLITQISPPSRPGDQVEFIQTQSLSNQPAPVLPAFESVGGSSGGGE